MRKALALALFIGIALINTSCNSDKKTMFMNNFVHTYFPDTEVVATIKDGFDYDVTLSDYTQISFDGSLFGKLDWDEVDCRRANMNTAVLVSRLYGGQTITKIAKDNRGWDIELTNGIELEFDKRFNVVDMDD